MIVEPKREILLGPLLRAGLRRSWAARDQLLRLAIVPLAVLVAVRMPLQQAMFQMMAARPDPLSADSAASAATVVPLLLVYSAALAVFSVNWLRQLTLGTSGAPGLGLAFAGRHFKFWLLMLAISTGMGVAAYIIVPILGAFGLPGQLAGVFGCLLIWAAFLVRISPAWIGIALDAPLSMRIAWQRTAGQGFKLLLAMLAIELPQMLGQHLVDTLFGLSGLGAAAPLTYALLTVAIQLIGLAVQLAILVTAFPYFLRETV
jgi:hypothetical protein